MILYRLIDGDPHTGHVDYRPRTCFLMTQLGEPIPEEAVNVRQDLERILEAHRIDLIDANSEITGKDFLVKIWNMIVAVPLAIAIVHKDMPQRTQCNVFYEIGIAQTLGKETIIIKGRGAEIPSDFVRTEYIEYDEHFEKKVSKYLKSFLNRADYYEKMAYQFDNNPLLAIDCLRRAFLISGNKNVRQQAKKISETLDLEVRARNSVEILLSDF